MSTETNTDSDTKSPAYHRTIAKTTDPTVRVVTRGGCNASVSKYHASHEGRPACGTETRHPTAKHVPWPTERARAWREPCAYCFPDGDNTAGKEGER